MFKIIRIKILLVILLSITVTHLGRFKNIEQPRIFGLSWNQSINDTDIKKIPDRPNSYYIKTPNPAKPYTKYVAQLDDDRMLTSITATFEASEQQCLNQRTFLMAMWRSRYSTSKIMKHTNYDIFYDKKEFHGEFVCNFISLSNSWLGTVSYSKYNNDKRKT